MESVERGPQAPEKAPEKPPRAVWRRRLLAVVLGLLLAFAVRRLVYFGVPDELAGVAWERLEEGSGEWLPVRVVGLGPGAGGTPDVYLAWASYDAGVLVSLDLAVDVTRTPEVREERLTVAPGRVAFTGRPAELSAPTTVEALAVDEPAPREAEWGLSERLAGFLSAWQDWGQGAVPRRVQVSLPAPARVEALRFVAGDRLAVTTPEGELELDLAGGALSTGAHLASVHAPVQARPALFSWAVDQLRYSSLVGPERLQELEDVYLSLVDAWQGVREAAPDLVDPEPDLPAQLGRLGAEPAPGQAWPPPPIPPMVANARPREGQWVERDPAFVGRPEGAPPLLYTTFVRPDPERPRSTRVYITVWDPEWLDLGWAAGTVEPRSTHGHVGTGRVPADVLPRLVAGFNGGFQAVDGAFGMATDEGPFLPPVPYGATVGRLADGRVGIGTWPDGEVGPDAPVTFRQNLTALVEDGQVNPYGRTFWGGVSRSLEDTTRTDRTALCLTTRHHMAYFWGASVTVAALADAMLAAGCENGLLLDINFSNTVFETYRVARTGELPDLDRELDEELERAGAVPGHPELDYRMQAMAPGMTRVGRPRYIRAELRDFFYLALRPAAAGPPLPFLCALAPVDAGGPTPPRAFRCELPGGGELFALDTRRVRASVAEAGSGAEAWIGWGVAAEALGPGPGPALVLAPGPHGGTVARVVADAAAVSEEGGIVLRGTPPRALHPAQAGPAGLLFAVDGDGQLLVRATTAPGAAAAHATLAQAGLPEALFVAGGDRVLAVAPDDAPMALPLFPDTVPVSSRVWLPKHWEARRRIEEQGLTRQYVQIRHYRERDAPEGVGDGATDSP